VCNKASNENTQKHVQIFKIYRKGALDIYYGRVSLYLGIVHEILIFNKITAANHKNDGLKKSTKDNGK
jgi:hypothetical protein